MLTSLDSDMELESSVTEPDEASDICARADAKGVKHEGDLHGKGELGGTPVERAKEEVNHNADIDGD